MIWFMRFCFLVREAPEASLLLLSIEDISSCCTPPPFVSKLKDFLILLVAEEGIWATGAVDPKSSTTEKTFAYLLVTLFWPVLPPRSFDFDAFMRELLAPFFDTKFIF